MTSRDRLILGGLLGLGLALSAAGGLAQQPSTRPAAQAPATGSETLKERLSDKASDEQRVDNCKVPADRRGPTPRPEACGADETQAAGTKPTAGDTMPMR